MKKERRCGILPKGYILQNGKSNLLGYGTMWHYPCAHEYNGKLYIIYSADTGKGRGAVMTVIDL